MKVVCIAKMGDWWTTSELEIGSIYEVLTESLDSTGVLGQQGYLYYTIKTKKGSQGWIRSDNFVTLEESRNNKIDDIIG
jgi:hypothetical protein